MKLSGTLGLDKLVSIAKVCMKMNTSSLTKSLSLILQLLAEITGIRALQQLELPVFSKTWDDVANTVLTCLYQVLGRSKLPSFTQMRWNRSQIWTLQIQMLICLSILLQVKHQPMALL